MRIDEECILFQFDDELQRQRAKRRIVDILHRNFLLEEGEEGDFSIEKLLDTQLGIVSHSAFCRYALWRLSNDESVLDVKEALKRAHVP